jgi:carbon starvation protein CstA
VLDSLFFSVLGIAVLMTVLAAFDRDEIAWPVLAIPSWLICAVTVSNIDTRHVFLDNMNRIVEHTTTYRGGAHMMYFFFAFALVFIILFFNRVLEMYRETATKKIG